VVAWPGRLKIDDGGVKCESLLETANAAVLVAFVEFRVTWQITGDPATAVFGEHERDTGLSPTSTSEVRMDKFCTAALIVAFSS